MTTTRKPVLSYSYVVRLPRELGEQLRERARVEDRPIARVIRQAIREELARPGKPLKDRERA